MGNYSTSPEVRTGYILAQVIAGDFLLILQHAIHGLHIPCSHRCVALRGICDARVGTVYVLHIAYHFQPEHQSNQ